MMGGNQCPINQITISVTTAWRRCYKNTIEALGPDLVANPQLAEVLNRMVDDQVQQYDASQNGKIRISDGGLADLIGLGKDAPADLGQVQVSPGVVN